MQRIKAVNNNEEVPKDILTQIIKSASCKSSIVLEDLVDDFATFFIAGIIRQTKLNLLNHDLMNAGQETTALLLSFSLIMILQHPEVKQRYL